VWLFPAVARLDNSLAHASVKLWMMATKCFQSSKRSGERTTASERAEAYGIDLSLLDDNLLLTPSERLAQNDAALEFANGLRDAIKNARP